MDQPPSSEQVTIHRRTARPVRAAPQPAGLNTRREDQWIFRKLAGADRRGTKLPPQFANASEFDFDTVAAEGALERANHRICCEGAGPYRHSQLGRSSAWFISGLSNNLATFINLQQNHNHHGPHSRSKKQSSRLADLIGKICWPAWLTGQCLSCCCIRVAGRDLARFCQRGRFKTELRKVARDRDVRPSQPHDRIRRHVPQLPPRKDSDGECDALADWQNAQSFSASERAAQYTDAMTRDGGAGCRVRSFAAHFGERQIIELSVLIGLQHARAGIHGARIDPAAPSVTAGAWLLRTYWRKCYTA